MQIAALMNIHANPDLVKDTLDSVRHYMTKDILSVVDEAGVGNFQGEKLPCHTVVGFRHGFSKAPYRNTTFGLRQILSLFPKADWYCYLEPDVLVASDEFKQELTNEFWCVGNNHRIGKMKIPFVEKMIGRNIEKSHYLLGCCVFYHRDFLMTLNRLKFFDRFLEITQVFEKGFYPEYQGYDLTEHLYPSLAVALGGRVGQLACWKENRWVGSQSYPMRWRPELEDIYEEGSLLHPIKDVEHPARRHHRSNRRNHDQ